MAEHPNTAKIRAAYDAFAAADLPNVLEAFAPDGVFHAAGDGPLAGDHKGREAIGTALIGSFQMTGGTQRIDVKSLYADDEHAVIVVHETATRARDGATLDIDEVHLAVLDRDGLVVELWDIPSDPDVHDAFFAG